jgi:hypothetical protein
MPEVDKSKILKIGEVLNNADRPLKEAVLSNASANVFRTLPSFSNTNSPIALDKCRTI